MGNLVFKSDFKVKALEIFRSVVSSGDSVIVTDNALLSRFVHIAVSTVCHWKYCEDPCSNDATKPKDDNAWDTA